MPRMTRTGNLIAVQFAPEDVFRLRSELRRLEAEERRLRQTIENDASLWAALREGAVATESSAGQARAIRYRRSLVAMARRQARERRKALEQMFARHCGENDRA